MKFVGKIALISVLSLFAAEIICFGVAASRHLLPWPLPWNTVIGFSDGKHLLRSEQLGRVAIPNNLFHHVRLDGEKTIFDVQYSTDEFGHRVTPDQESSLRKKFLVFLGCSYTWGEGVGNRETLPYFVSQMDGEYKVYNWGLHGYGPNNVLAQLEQGNISKEITEPSGITIYNFMNFHVGRAIGSRMQSVGWWRYNPYYVLGENGLPIRKGNFTDDRAVITMFYNLLSLSNIVNLFNIDFPLSYSEKDFELTAKLIISSKELAEKKIGGKFYVVFFPGASYGARIAPYLKAAGVEFKDLSGFEFPDDGESYFIEGDGHPNARAYKAVAEKIVGTILK